MEDTEKTNRQELRIKADISISKAKEIILKSIPNDEIQAIYIKGSYVQGEMQPDSDVDIVVILKNDKYLPALYELTQKYGKIVNPPFQIVAYTMEELQTGRWSPIRTKNATTISAFVKHFDQFPLIYGSKPNGQLFTRTDIKDLTALISAFEKNFLPDFEKGTFKFNEIVKSVLWLAEREQRALGLKPDYSWQKLSDSIKDENHIMHLALKLRRQKEISNDEQDEFMKKLENYLSLLKENYKNFIKSCCCAIAYFVFTLSNQNLYHSLSFSL